MRIAPRYFILALAALLSACGGRGQAPFPVESAFDTAVVDYANGPCTVVITVHRDRTAQSKSACVNWRSGTATLPPTVVSLLFSDLQAAQPLNTLLACPGVDVSTSVAWNDQQTPSIGTCAGTSTAEQNLAYEVSDVVTAFIPMP